MNWRDHTLSCQRIRNSGKIAAIVHPGNGDYTIHYIDTVGIGGLGNSCGNAKVTGIGIGQIGNGVAQGIARQPEAAATIQTAGIILAALIEGAALFGLVITILFKFF